MTLLKHLKLGMKVSIGFGMIFILLVTAVIFSLVNINKLNDHFVEYTAISRDEMLVGRIQANLLETRLASENYIQHGGENYKKTFENRYRMMESFIFDLKGNMNKSEGQSIMEHILERAREYKSDFNKVVQYNEKRKELYNVLVDKGPEMEQSLTELLELAHLSQDEALVYGAGHALNQLLAARLHVSRFLELSEPERIKQVSSSFIEMDRLITFLEERVNTEREKELLEGVKKNKEVYSEHFKQMSSLIEDRNKVIAHLDQIGPEVSAIAEDVKLLIIEEQATYIPMMNIEYQRMVRTMVLLSVLALLFAIMIALGIIKMVIHPVRTVTNTFKEISEGEANLEVRLKVNAKDELGEMAKYFNRFMEKLHIILTENKNQSWLKTGEAELSEKMSANKDIKQLSDSIIAYTANYLSAQIGRFYIKTENDSYHLYGTYGYREFDKSSAQIAMGDGLIGQAALKKQRIIITDVPEDYLKIKSGIGTACPKYIVIVPFLFNNEVIGVMELGSFSAFGAIELKFLDEISRSIAVNISSVKAQKQTEELLEKTLIQADELQVQQEELRQSNEEFEEQTKALTESEERLQEQQEELKAINEELVEHAKNLEIQKNDINKKNDHLILAQKEIQEKAEALETVNKYKSEFLANMSHELRTPLNSILVLSELLSNKKDFSPLTEKQLEFASTIHQSGSELLRLINDVLDLSKIEVGKMEVHLEPMSFKELAYSMTKSFEQIAINKGITFNVVVDEKLPHTIVTDSHKVKQITNNLLSNAFKFTEKGGIILKMSYMDSKFLKDKTPQFETGVLISVIDTGIGVPSDKQSMIFEAFKQSDGTISRKYGGTGLGLSITKELAELLGGNIYLESEENKGSTFAFALPFESTDDNQHEEEALSTEELKEDSARIVEQVQEMLRNPSAGDEEKVLLIIEDDAHFAGILEEAGKTKGYKCIIAGSGEEGIEHAKKYKLDAILLDIGLPGMNGWEVVGRLRRTHAVNVPIHILSGNKPIGSEIDETSVIGYVQKPVSLEKMQEVFHKIEEAMAKSFKRLLLLGIEEDTRVRLEEMLGQKDILISSLNLGEEVIDLLKIEDFDCIILDLAFRDMGGVDLLRQLTSKMNRHIPIIIYTDSDLTEDEANELHKYAKSIILQGKKSMERLISEVHLFLHEINSRNDDTEGNTLGAAKEQEEGLRGRKILVVDDDMRNVFALSSILEEKGIKIVVGRNGREGIDKLIEHTDIELVLMDIMMPEMDGYEAMKQIRAHKHFAKVPIIALTAKAMKEDRQKCIEAGANDYLTKPIQTDRLISLLRVWLYK